MSLIIPVYKVDFPDIKSIFKMPSAPVEITFNHCVSDQSNLSSSPPVGGQKSLTVPALTIPVSSTRRRSEAVTSQLHTSGCDLPRRHSSVEVKPSMLQYISSVFKASANDLSKRDLNVLAPTSM